MDFDWDPEKAAKNERKHGISFEQASRVFFDAWAIEDLDEAHAATETRFIIIGLAEMRLLRVVYTVRDKVRIISAEDARPVERDAYNKNRNEYDR